MPKAIATIRSEISTLLPNNTARTITPTRIRDRLTDLTDWCELLEAGVGAKCDTVAGLTSLTVTNGTTVHLLGYYTRGDGGGQDLFWDSASTNTVNGVTVFQGPTGTGRFISKNSRVVSASQAGCIGDDIVDNTARFNALVTCGADTIVVEGGPYKITDTITLTSDRQRWIGTGVIRQSASIKNIFTVTAKYVRIDGLLMIGLGTYPVASDFTKSCGIFADGANGLEVRNCRFRGFGVAAIQLRNTIGYRILGNYTSSTVTTASDSGGDVITWGGCRDGSIIGNTLGSDTHNAIYIGSNSEDTNTVIANNVISCFDVNGARVTPALRRHGITLNYNPGSETRQSVSCTGNVIDGTLGAAIYFIGDGGMISIVGNSIRNSGLDAVTDPSLNGGIAILGQAEGIIVANNVLFNCTTSTCGAININKLAGYDRKTPTKVIGNTITNCSAYGISIKGISQWVDVSGNTIWECTQTGIFVALDAGTDGDGITIRNNKISLAAQLRGMFIDTAGTTNKVVVEDNDILFSGTKGTNQVNAGIYCQTDNVIARRNHIKGFQSGYYVYTPVATGRNTQFIIEQNYFEDLGNAICLRGNGGHDRAYYDPSNTFDNCTARSDGDGLYAAGFPGYVNRDTGKVVLFASSLPANGTYAVGDRIENTAPAPTGYAGWVCTTAGSPGTLKGYGTIQA